MRRRWFHGRPLHGAGVEDIAWLTPQGTAMTEEDWSTGFAKSLMVFLNGKAIAGRGPRGERIEDDSFLLLFNAHHEPVEFTVSSVGGEREWFARVDTATPELQWRPALEPGDRVTIEARSMLVLSNREQPLP
jgi:glycogen operon protein